MSSVTIGHTRATADKLRQEQTGILNIKTEQHRTALRRAKYNKYNKYNIYNIYITNVRLNGHKFTTSWDTTERSLHNTTSTTGLGVGLYCQCDYLVMSPVTHQHRVPQKVQRKRRVAK